MSEAATAPDKPATEVALRPFVPHGGGQPAHQVTEETRAKVRAHARSLLPQEMIARLCGIGLITLRRHYHDDWEQGRAETLAQIAAQYVKAAIHGPDSEGVTGDPDRQRFILAKVVWNKQHLELSGPGGGPIPVLDLSHFSPDDLQTYGRLAALAAGIDPDSVPELVELTAERVE